MRKTFMMTSIPLLMIFLFLYLSNIRADSPKSYKLSLIGEKNWADVSQLNLPKEEKKELLYKSNALYAAHNQRQEDHILAFSPNGKFKVEMRGTGNPLDEDLGVPTIYDSLGKKVWEDTVGFWVLLSNNGDYFVSIGAEASVIVFHKISDTSSTLGKRPPFVHGYRFGFTRDGKYFVAAGSSLDLYTAAGDIIWRKNTNSGSTCDLAFSDDAGVIALAKMPSLGDFREPVISDIKDTLQTRLLDRSLKNTYLFILNRNGEVLHQEVLDWPVVHKMTVSPKGDFLAVGGYYNLSIFDVNAKKVIGKYEQNSINFSYCSMAFSPSSDLLALQSYRNLYLLNLKGEITDYAELTDDFDTRPKGPTLAFSDSGKILLASSINKLYAFKIKEK